MRKILVLRGGALGDFIVTLPALALLRKRWPDARIELAGNATAAALAIDCGLIDAAHSQHEARWSGLFSRDALKPDFAAWLASFDLVVNFWPDADGALRARFPTRAEQIFLHGDAQPKTAPAAAHYCEALRPLGFAGDEYFFGVKARQAECNARSIVAIHPGSGSPKKNWPIDRWAALCDWLKREHHAELLVVAGEADVAQADALSRFGSAARNLPLRELVEKFSGCRLFIGHDSGVSHLAAACGAPCVLLFGPTDPAMWAPPAPHVEVIRRGETLESVSLDDVTQKVSAML